MAFASHSLWQIEFVNAKFAALMPTVTDQLNGTSSAAGAVRVQLPRRYIIANDPVVQPVSATFASGVPTNKTLSRTVLADNFVDVNVYDNAGARIVRPFVITIVGVAAP